jgi:hypothetical protein
VHLRSIRFSANFDLVVIFATDRSTLGRLAPLPHSAPLATALITLASLTTLITFAALIAFAALTIFAALAALSILATLATLATLAVLPALSLPTLSTATHSGCVAASVEMLVHLLLPCEALRAHLRSRQRHR